MAKPHICFWGLLAILFIYSGCIKGDVVPYSTVSSPSSTAPTSASIDSAGEVSSEEPLVAPQPIGIADLFTVKEIFTYGGKARWLDDETILFYHEPIEIYHHENNELLSVDSPNNNIIDSVAIKSPEEFGAAYWNGSSIRDYVFFEERKAVRFGTVEEASRIIISPSLTHIAYFTQNSDEAVIARQSDFSIWMFDVQTGEKNCIEHPTIHQVNVREITAWWMPDGIHLVIAPSSHPFGEPDGETPVMFDHILLYNTRTRTCKQIDIPLRYTDVAPAKDSQSLFFVTEQDGKYSIMQQDIATGVRIELPICFTEILSESYPRSVLFGHSEFGWEPKFNTQGQGLQGIMYYALQNPYDACIQYYDFSTSTDVDLSLLGVFENLGITFNMDNGDISDWYQCEVSPSGDSILIKLKDRTFVLERR